MYVNIIAERIASMSATYSDTHKKRDCDFHQQSRLVEQQNDISNEYVRQYQSFVRFIEDNIIYLDGFG